MRFEASDDTSAGYKRLGYICVRQNNSEEASEYVQDLQTSASCGFPCCQKRYLTAVMCSLGFVITFGFRCTIGVATGYFRQHYNATLPYGSDTGHSSERHIKWSASVIGTVESAFFWGYLVSQIPGGIIANKFSAARVFSVTTLGSSVLNLLLPTALRASFELSVIIRVLQGLLEGCLFPACHGIWSHWAPPRERSRLGTIAYSGGYIGAFFGLLISGVLTQNLGWSAPFYIYGTAGIIWYGVWLCCVYDKPSVHPCITEEERQFIKLSIGENMDLDGSIWNIPWAKFLTSMPVYAIIVANFARNWSVHLLITEPTKYFSDVFDYNLSQSGFFSALPHLIMAISMLAGGYLADWMREKLTTTAVRKVLNTAGFVLYGIFLLGVGYTKSASAAIICLAISIGFSALTMSGFNLNHLDIAPRYASFLMGLSNGIGSLSSILVPIVTVQLVKDHRQESWSKVFLITSLISFVSAIFYAIFATGERQAWAEAAVNEEPWRPPDEPPVEYNDDDQGGAVHAAEAPLYPTRTVFVQERH